MHGISLKSLIGNSYTLGPNKGNICPTYPKDYCFHGNDPLIVNKAIIIAQHLVKMPTGDIRVSENVWFRRRTAEGASLSRPDRRVLASLAS